MPLRFLNPNYHVILIHYPLGVFVLGVMLELFSFMWRRSSVRLAARWMILLGALLSLPAATSGIYALLDIQHQDKSMAWAQRSAYLSRHVWVMGSATILAVLCAIIGLGASNRMRHKLRPILLAGFVAAVGLMVYGAWFGGETVYRQGTAVAMIKYKAAEADGDKPAEARPILKIPAEPRIDLKDKDERYNNIVRYYLGGDLQLHIIVSGLAFAAALGALGLSIRRYTSLRAAEEAEYEEVKQETGVIGGPPRRVTDDVTVLRTLNPSVLVDPDDAKFPVARFWLIAALAALATATAGYWLMSGTEFFKMDGLKSSFWSSVQPDNIRHFAHMILGGSLVVLALLFCMTAAWLPHRPMPLMFFATLLLLVIAAQIWIGVQLTFDKNDGPQKKLLFHLHVPEEEQPASHGAAGMP